MIYPKLGVPRSREELFPGLPGLPWFPWLLGPPGLLGLPGLPWLPGLAEPMWDALTSDLGQP